jgi:hypothetical protein
MVYVGRFAGVLLMVLGCAPALAQSVSPDGSVISNDTGTLTTAAGTWSFGGPAPGRPGEWLILLNGSASNGGISASLEVASGGQIYALTASQGWFIWQNGGWTPTSAPSPASPPATLTLTFSPQMPSIPDNTPPGTVVATATAAWSDGSPFTGTIMFGSPYGDDGGTFALSCVQCAAANIVINPAGLGVMGDGGSVQSITIVATQ